MLTTIKAFLLACILPVCVVLAVYGILCLDWEWVKGIGVSVKDRAKDVCSPCVREGSIGNKLFGWMKSKKQGTPAVQSAPKS